MQRRVDRHDVAHTHERLGVRVVRDVEVLLEGGNTVAIGVVQPNLERLQPSQYRGANPPGPDGANLHPLQVVGARHAVRDVPAARDDPLVGRDVVAHERQDQHHYVLGDADAVRVRHLGDGEAPVDRSLEINVV
jgi:hypothetical protein